MALDTLGHLLAVQESVPPMHKSAHTVRSGSRSAACHQRIGLTQAFVDQGYNEQEPAQAARQKGIQLHGINAQRGCHATQCR